MVEFGSEGLSIVTAPPPPVHNPVSPAPGELALSVNPDPGHAAGKSGPAKASLTGNTVWVTS